MGLDPDRRHQVVATLCGEDVRVEVVRSALPAGVAPALRRGEQSNAEQMLGDLDRLSALDLPDADAALRAWLGRARELLVTDARRAVLGAAIADLGPERAEVDGAGCDGWRLNCAEPCPKKSP